MGKKSQEKADTALNAQNQIAQKQTDLADKLVSESDPARMQALNTYTGIAGGNQPGIQKYVAPQVNAIAQQFNMARKSAESMPAGGLRDKFLKDITLQEAGAKNQAYSGGVSDSLARMATMGISGTNAGQSSLSSAAGTYSNVAGNYNDMASSKGGMAGAGIGAAGTIAASAIAL
jgi:hypothetical protein